MVSTGPGRQGYAWRKLSARLREELPPACHICGEWIDKALHHYDAKSWTLDHVKSLSEAPHLAEDESNLRPAHRGCNSSRGGILGNERKMGPPRQSRRW